jgi:hypothetical protein
VVLRAVVLTPVLVELLEVALSYADHRGSSSKTGAQSNQEHHPYVSFEMKTYEVSRAVWNPRNVTPEVMQPVTPAKSNEAPEA